MAPDIKPPSAGLYASSFCLKFAEAFLVNSYAPPIAAVVPLACVLLLSQLLPVAKSMFPPPLAYVPKVAVVPPKRVNAPIAPTFCLVKVFWIVEMNAPAAAVTDVALMADPTASLGW